MMMLLALVFAAATAYTPAPQSTDANSSWQKRHAAKLAEAQGGGSDVVFIGDDLVQTFPESWGAKDVWERNWAAAPYRAMNLGFSGDRTENVLWRVQNGELDGFTAKAIVLAIGHTNFKVRGDSVADTVQGVSAILDAIKAKQPTAKIVLCAIPPQYATRDTAYLEKVAAANVEFAKLADGATVRWCGYDKAFRRADSGYIRWTGAVTPFVNAIFRNDVAPTEGESQVRTFQPETGAGIVNADAIISAKRFVEANTNEARVVLRATDNAIVDTELAKYSDGRRVIWCAVNGDEAVAALVSEAKATDQLPVGAYYAPGDGEVVVYDSIDALRPVTRICESSWRGPDWWGDRLARNRDTIKASGGTIDFVFAGDSITHFWEDYGPVNFKTLTDTYSILNCGYGGDQTQNVLWRFQNGELDGYTAKAVMLMIGTNNNGIGGYNPTNTFEGVKACVNLIKAKQPTAKVLLMAYLPRAVGTTDGACADNAANLLNLETTRLLKAEYANDAAVTIFDIYDQFLGADGKIPKALMEDYIHPTELGYTIWRGAVQPTFVALTGKEPARQHGDYTWQAVGGVLDGRFDNPAHWSLGWVPGAGDNAIIGKGLSSDFTVTFPEGVCENAAAKFDIVAVNGKTVTLDLSETDFRRPENTEGQYDLYNAFTIRCWDDSKDILTLNPANAVPDAQTAPHAELANTVVTLSQPAQKRITLDFNGGTVNFDNVLGHEWTNETYPRLYLFNFNNNGWSATAPVLDSAEITFRNGASLQAHNVCVQGNAATNVLRFSGGTHALVGLRLPGKYDGQNMAVERTVTDVVVENGANLTVDKLLYFDAATAAQRVERIFVKPLSHVTVKAMGQGYGDSQTIVDGGTFEFGAGNQDFNPGTPNYDAVRFTARNGGLLLANHGGGGLGLYLGKGGTHRKGLAYLDVEDATLRVLPDGKINFYNGGASFGPGALVDLQGGTLNFAGNTATPIGVAFDGATVTNKASFSFGGTGLANVVINDTTLVAEADVNFDDATVDVQDSDISVASGKRLYLGYNGGKSATVTFRSGTVTAASKTGNTIEVGWMGTGRLNVYGGTLNLGRLRLGASFTAGTDKSIENVLDVEGGFVNVQEDGNGDGICANYNANRTSRIILNGGVLRFYRLYKSAGTAYLEANGGTLQLNNDSGNAIRDMDGLFVGPKGLTIDNDGHTVDFTAAFADKADANGEGRIVVKGAGTTKFTGSLAAVSAFVADEGTVDLSGLPSDGLGSLTATGTAVLKLDPSKTIPLAGGLELANVRVAFTTAPVLGNTYDLFSYASPMSAASRAALEDALVVEGLPSGGVADFAQVEANGGYALRATIRMVQNTPLDVTVSRTIEEDIKYKAADSVTATVAAGATLTLAGKVGKGAFVKDGAGEVTFTGTDNLLVGGFSLLDGRLVTSDPAQLGGGKAGNGKVALRNGVLRLAGADGTDYGDLFTFAQESTNDHVIVESAAEATMDLPPSAKHTGGLTKRGAERLTFKVTGSVSSIGGEGMHDHSKGFWSERSSLVFPQLFDATTGLMTNGTFGAFNINEGELRLVGQGAGAAVSTTGDLAIALPTTGGSAQPGLWLDNVAWTSETWNRHVYIASCIKYSTPVVADFADEPYLVLTNGASLTANSLYVNRLNNNTKTRTKIDVTASTLNLTYGLYPSRGQAGEARATYDFRDNSKLIVGGNGGILLAREFTMNFDHSLCARDEATLTPTFICQEPGWDNATQTFTINVRNGSRFCVGSVTPSATKVPVHPLTFVFDDSEWIPVSPTEAGDYTFEWAQPEKILIVADEGGLKLPVPAERTWTMNHPVTGAGDLVNSGAGTLALGASFEKAEGAVVADDGTVDFGGNEIGVTLAGAGTFANGTLADGAIRLDPAAAEKIPTIASTLAFSGKTRVHLGYGGERPPMGTAITVAKFEGAAPDVSTWRLASGSRAVGEFAVDPVAKTVTVTPQPSGIMMILD